MDELDTVREIDGVELVSPAPPQAIRPIPIAVKKISKNIH
jgi:hypothetical protein